MARKRRKPQEIVAKLRQVDVLTSQRQGVADAIRSTGVTEGVLSRMGPMKALAGCFFSGA